MSIQNLVFLICETCNCRCSYCYQQKRNKTMSETTARAALTGFLNSPITTDPVNIIFSGGEPLMNFPVIEEIVHHSEATVSRSGKPNRYSLISNGYLLDEDILEFLNRYRFQLQLNVTAVKADPESGRETGSSLKERIRAILSYEHIKLFLNSVFDAGSVAHATATAAPLLALNAAPVNVSISLHRDFNEMTLKQAETEWHGLHDLAFEHYQSSGVILIENFATPPQQRIWRCGAAGNSLTITPDGEIWGCALFYEYQKKYARESFITRYGLGTVADISSRFPDIYRMKRSNYLDLRMDHFSCAGEPCFLCQRLSDCAVCPMIHALKHQRMKEIPTVACRLNRIQRDENHAFWDRVRRHPPCQHPECHC